MLQVCFNIHIWSMEERYLPVKGGSGGGGVYVCVWVVSRLWCAVCCVLGKQSTIPVLFVCWVFVCWGGGNLDS